MIGMQERENVQLRLTLKCHVLFIFLCACLTNTVVTQNSSGLLQISEFSAPTGCRTVATRLGL
jgi:hypothetical protein